MDFSKRQPAISINDSGTLGFGIGYQGKTLYIHFLFKEIEIDFKEIEIDFKKRAVK